MELEKFCLEMGFDADFRKNIEPYWAELLENSSSEMPFFAERGFYTEYYPLCKRDDANEIIAQMDEVASVICQNPFAARYASMIYYALVYGNKPLLNFKWVEAEKLFGRNSGIFTLMIALGALVPIRKKHIELGLDESYMLGIADWIGVTLDIYAAARNGVKGHPFPMLYWLRFSITGELFRIGRLEFFDCKWYDVMPWVYQNRKDGRLAVLCRNGWTFDKDGFRVKSDSGEADFTAELCEKDGNVTGVWINPFGFPEKDKKLTLDPAEWELVCSADDICPTLHIPAGGGMKLDVIRQSMIEAKKFYREVFDREVKIFCCTSWIFNPAWEKELPDSNFAAWQRNSYLTPCDEPNGMPGVFFVYGNGDLDPRKCEQKSSLHKAFCRILDRGEKLRNGAMFIMAEDVEKMGTEPYRREYKF